METDMHRNHSYKNHQHVHASPGLEAGYLEQALAHKGHNGIDMAKDFLRRFYIVSILLVPLFILSSPGQHLLGYENFAFRPYVQFFLASVIFYFSLVFFEHAWHEIKMRVFGMMTLVSVAVGAGYLFSAVSTFMPELEEEFYIEISTLIWILLFGHFLEAKSATAAGNALEEVSKLLPSQAHVIRNGDIIDISVGSLQKGDLVLVRPGEKVPADAVIIKGQAEFDESHLTGESKPTSKTKGDEVVAGAISLNSAVEIRLSRVGETSTVGQIKKLITQAQETKPATQRLADRAASWLTFVALLTAISAFLIWLLVLGETFVFALTLSITVLVIACPHALGLAIPTVTTIATKIAVDNGFFIKNLAKLETMRRTDYVVFDKTGTLTLGQFGITDIIPISSTKQVRNVSNINDLTPNQVQILETAASLEQQSSHSIAISITGFAKSNEIALKDVTNFHNILGKGVTGMVNNQAYFLGNKRLAAERDLLNEITEIIHQKLTSEEKTVIFLANDKKIIGIIGLADQIKNSSYKAVKDLHAQGIQVAMITGDSKRVAKNVARELGIDTYFAEVLPQNKYEYVKKLQSKGHTVVMVGDGVNDAPALTQADVGIAIGTGTDIAVEAGNVILTRNNPADIPRLVTLSKKTYQKMVQNLFWALGYNIIALPAAAGVFIPFGFRLSPEIGAILMSLSTVIVVFNATRLRSINIAISG
ncbi:MAG: heavy metal translocating P-type ATPase [Patescibacteria group bacterium]|jgi:Cu2+-exporting ATPase